MDRHEWVVRTEPAPARPTRGGGGDRVGRQPPVWAGTWLTQRVASVDRHQRQIHLNVRGRAILQGSGGRCLTSFGRRRSPVTGRSSDPHARHVGVAPRATRGPRSRTATASRSNTTNDAPRGREPASRALAEDPMMQGGEVTAPVPIHDQLASSTVPAGICSRTRRRSRGNTDPAACAGASADRPAGRGGGMRKGLKFGDSPRATPTGPLAAAARPLTEAEMVTGNSLTQ